MFKNRYILFLISLVAFSGCDVKPKVITVTPNKNQVRPQSMGAIVVSPVKEEILIKKNPNSGVKVAVPKNRPTLDIKELSLNQNDEHKKEVIERIPFPEWEYKRLKKIGHYTVSGKIYLHSSVSDEDITYGRIKLYLNPVTSYSKQWYQDSYIGGYKLSPVDKRLNNYLKVEYTKEDGTFEFFGVPKGNYYLIGTISCGEKCGYKENKIIRLVKEIFVNDDIGDIEITKIVP